MTAPTLTARVAPTGRRLPEGHRFTIAFSAKPNICLWEISGNPPGYDGEDLIDITTQHNEVVRQFHPRSLITVTNSTWTVAYDPKAYTEAEVRGMINRNQSMTVHFSDGSTLTFYAALLRFEPEEASIGEFPTATIEIGPTNTDPVTGGEELPVMVEVSGT